MFCKLTSVPTVKLIDKRVLVLDIGWDSPVTLHADDDIKLWWATRRPSSGLKCSEVQTTYLHTLILYNATFYRSLQQVSRTCQLPRTSTQQSMQAFAKIDFI